MNVLTRLTGLPENVDDRRAADVDVQLLELAEYPRIALAGLPSDPQDDLPDVLRRAWPSRPAGHRLGLVLLVGSLDPLHERCWLDDRHQITDGGPQRPGQPDEPIPLSGGHPDWSLDPSAEHLVLCLEELDLPVQLTRA